MRSENGMVERTDREIDIIVDEEKFIRGQIKYLKENGTKEELEKFIKDECPKPKYTES